MSPQNGAHASVFGSGKKEQFSSDVVSLYSTLAIEALLVPITFRIYAMNYSNVIVWLSQLAASLSITRHDGRWALASIDLTFVYFLLLLLIFKNSNLVHFSCKFSN